MAPLKKYIWLVDTLMHSGNSGLTLEQINHRYIYDDVEDGGGYDKRTFHRHRKEVKDIFGIEIECRKNGQDYRYRIADSGDNDYFQRWLLDSIAINRVVEASKDTAEYIGVERTHADSLPQMLEALKDKKMISFDYSPFSITHSTHYFNFQPHAVKMFERRWYLIGRYDEDSPHRIYALDRMTNVEIQEESYQRDSEFSLTKMFDGAYGIYVDDRPIESIWLKVDAKQLPYLLSLPLHPSQIELRHNKEFSILSLRVRPTYDLCQKLLSFGSKIEVLKPDYLREELGEEIQKMAARYQKQEED